MLLLLLSLFITFQVLGLFTSVRLRVRMASFGSGDPKPASHAATLYHEAFRTMFLLQLITSQQQTNLKFPTLHSFVGCSPTPLVRNNVGPKPTWAKYGGGANQWGLSSTHQLSVTSSPCFVHLRPTSPKQSTADFTTNDPATAPTNLMSALPCAVFRL